MLMETLIDSLQKLIALHVDSRFIYQVAIDSLFLAFTKPKPLFTDSEKTKAAFLIEAALDRLESSFVILHGSLNPDKRQNAQCCRSDLQFLVDEFKDDETYEKLKSILSCDPVRCVEEYIKYTKGIEPEYFKLPPQDLTNIPKSHIWWYEDVDENDLM